jgi:two-component system cell cycle sensor histidine kinase/response regulator CckA
LLPRHVSEAQPVKADQQPTSPGAAAPAEKPAQEAVRDLSGSATVLLVEDEDAVRMGGVRALTSRGYTVHEASSGVEALEIYHELEGRIDIVVSDVVMPEMDGPTLLGELRKLQPDIKFIFVSGYAEDAFARNLPADAQFGFLPKPFSLKQLATVVKEVLEK